MGNYTFELRCDVPLPNGTVAELDENNNMATYYGSTAACMADLNVGFPCEMPVTPVDPAPPGTATYHAVVQNGGNATAMGPIEVRFDVSTGGSYTVQYPGDLAQGESVPVQVDAPAVPSATASLAVTVDPQNTVPEFHEDNNSVSDALCHEYYPTVCLGGWGWPLHPVQGYSSPVSVLLAKSYLYTASQVKVRFEVCGPDISGTALLGDVLVDPAQAHCYCGVGVTLPGSFLFSSVGTYTFTFTVDPDNEIAECDEGNNVLTRQITITNLPDLRVLSQHINPSSLNPDVNEPVTLDVTYENIGYGNLGSTFALKVMANNDELATVANVPGLVSGGTHTVNIPVPFSSPLVGVHVFRAIIDANDEVVEADELNNEATRAIVVGAAANLYFATLAANTTTPGIGQLLTVSATVRNNGDLPIGADVQFYYVTQDLDTVPFGPVHHVEVDSAATTPPFGASWTVTQQPRALVARITNGSLMEFTYSDNEGRIAMGAITAQLASVPGCSNGLFGSLTAQAFGGVAPYTYLWDDGSTGNVLNAPPGDYSVTITDAEGRTTTANGTIAQSGDCEGALLDCAGVPGGPALPGTSCDDGDTNTGNDRWTAECNCEGLSLDCLGVPGGTALPGTTCSDGDANTINDTWTAGCSCVGTPTGGPCTGDQVVLQVLMDGEPGQVTWEFRNQAAIVVAAGSPGLPDAWNSVTACLGAATGGCYTFRLLDTFGDGITNGGWELRTTDGKLILRDDFASGSQSPSATPASPAYGSGHSFCLPLGPANIAATKCGIFNNQQDNKVYCNKVAGATQYQFEFSDPDAGFMRRIVRNTNYVKFSDMVANPLVPGVKYFARVRTNVDGPVADAHFGSGCEMGMAPLSVCSQLIQAPAYGHSCNETRTFNTNNSFIYAKPVVGATEYQFRIFNIGEGYDQTFTRSTYILQLKWNANVAPPLVNGSTYSVEVNVKVSGVFSGFCPSNCNITINNGGNSGLMAGTEHEGFGDAMLWPNPVRDGQVNLDLTGLKDKDQRITLDIQDIYGNLVFTQAFANNGARFSTVLQLPGDIASGVYLVNITVNGEHTVQRLSIIR